MNVTIESDSKPDLLLWLWRWRWSSKLVKVITTLLSRFMDDTCFSLLLSLSKFPKLSMIFCWPTYCPINFFTLFVVLYKYIFVQVYMFMYDVISRQQINAFHTTQSKSVQLWKCIQGHCNPLCFVFYQCICLHLFNSLHLQSTVVLISYQSGFLYE